MGMRTSRIAAATVAAALALGTAACNDTSDSGTGGGYGATSASPPVGTSVTVGRSPLGPVLTDQAGRVLYAFVNDKQRASSCVDECVATWPALAGVTPAVAGPGVATALLGSVRRGEGTMQATYGGWPLYYYAGDALPGDVTGQGEDGEWFVVGLDGTLVKTPA